MAETIDDNHLAARGVGLSTAFFEFIFMKKGAS